MSKDSTITWGFSMFVITYWRQWQRCKEGDDGCTQTTSIGVIIERGFRSTAQSTTWSGVESCWGRLASEASRGTRTLEDSRLKTNNN